MPNVDLLFVNSGTPRAVGDPRTDKLFGTHRLIGTTMGYIIAKTTAAITNFPTLRARVKFLRVSEAPDDLMQVSQLGSICLSVSCFGLVNMEYGTESMGNRRPHR